MDSGIEPTMLLLLRSSEESVDKADTVTGMVPRRFTLVNASPLIDHTKAHLDDCDDVKL